jgi:hypothetical protein
MNTPTIKSAAALSLAIIFADCAVGPNYKEPVPAVAPAFGALYDLAPTVTAASGHETQKYPETQFGD